MADDPVDPEDDRRFFSVDEANALVPELEERFGRIQAQVEKGREITGRLSSLGGAHPGAYRDQLRRVHAAIHVEVAAIQGLGAVIKDVNGGLVDFWHLRAGEEVLLCWKAGEERIGFFHDTTSGFAGRQPLGSSPGAPSADGADDDPGDDPEGDDGDDSGSVH